VKKLFLSTAKPSNLLLLQSELPNSLNIIDLSRVAYLKEGITKETIDQAINILNIKKLQEDKLSILDTNKPIAFNYEGEKYVLIPTRVKMTDQDQSDYAVTRVDNKGNLWLEGIFTSEEIKNNKSLTLKNGQKITLTIAAE
jgi:hypothetical protein